MKAREGFTLVEMLVVIGIIALLIGASLTGFSKMTKSAERARARELVSNVNTALSALFQSEGCWPQRLLANGGTGTLDADTAYVLAKKGYMSLTMQNGKLAGNDKFGIVTPWAIAVIKRTPGATTSTKVGFDSKRKTESTIADHVLHYAVDVNGDGITEIKQDDGNSLKVRATACVWCCDKGGYMGTVNKNKSGSGGIFSYSAGQIINE